MRRGTELALLDTVDHAYAAITEPSRWNDALDALAAVVDGRAAGIRIETFGRGVEQRWTGLDAAFDRAYVDHYWQHDPWAKSALEGAPGMVGFGDSITPRKLVEASAYHNDLAIPNGFDDLAGAVLERTPTRLVSIGVMKGRGQTRFTEDDAMLLGRLVPHFRRALDLAGRLEGATTTTGVTVSAPRVAELLAQRYKLTAAETRVALLVGRGLSPRAAAAELGVAWNTVRAHLREIYAKTETGSQSALARLVTLTEASLFSPSRT